MIVVLFFSDYIFNNFNPSCTFSCKEATKVKKKERLTAQEIIDKAIDDSCQGNCEIAQIAFTFREAYNIRVIDGIRFVDYNNYKPESKEMKLSDLDRLFVKGKLKLVSKIETENITVSLLN